MHFPMSCLCVSITYNFQKLSLRYGSKCMLYVSLFVKNLSTVEVGPPQLSTDARWQIIGMREAGMSLRQIAWRVGYHHSTISRIVNKHQNTNSVNDLPKSGRSSVTSDHENRALSRVIRRNPFINSTVLKRQWFPRFPHRAISSRTLRNRLKRAGYRSWRPVKGHCSRLDTKLNDYGGVRLVVAGIWYLGEWCIGPTKSDFCCMSRMAEFVFGGSQIPHMPKGTLLRQSLSVVGPLWVQVAPENCWW